MNSFLISSFILHPSPFLPPLPPNPCRRRPRGAHGFAAIWKGAVCWLIHRDSGGPRPLSILSIHCHATPPNEEWQDRTSVLETTDRTNDTNRGLRLGICRWIFCFHSFNLFDSWLNNKLTAGEILISIRYTESEWYSPVKGCFPENDCSFYGT